MRSEGCSVCTWRLGKSTQKVRLKSKLRWVGPMLVTNIISKNVYEIKDHRQKKMIVHATRLLLYEGSSYSPYKEVHDLYVSDLGELEVKKFLELRDSKKGLEVLVRWLGFNADDDSWEPLQIMYEDLPELVEKFIEGNNSVLFKKAKLFLKRKQKLFARSSKFLNHGWKEIEVTILKQCIRLYGCGRFTNIVRGKHLPGKSIQSLNFKLQKLLGRQSILEYSGIKLDVDEVFKYNVAKNGTDFLVEESRIVSRMEKKMKRFFNIFRFNLKNRKEEDIYFYRRLENKEEREDYYEFLVLNRHDGSKLNLVFPPLNDVEKEITRVRVLVEEDRSLNLKLKEKAKFLKNILFVIRGKFKKEDFPIEESFEE